MGDVLFYIRLPYCPRSNEKRVKLKAGTGPEKKSESGYPGFKDKQDDIMTINDPLTHEKIGSAMEVHRVPGDGFQEVIY